MAIKPLTYISPLIDVITIFDPLSAHTPISAHPIFPWKIIESTCSLYQECHLAHRGLHHRGQGGRSRLEQGEHQDRRIEGGGQQLNGQEPRMCGLLYMIFTFRIFTYHTVCFSQTESPGLPRMHPAFTPPAVPLKCTISYT